MALLGNLGLDLHLHSLSQDTLAKVLITLEIWAPIFKQHILAQLIIRTTIILLAIKSNLDVVQLHKLIHSFSILETLLQVRVILLRNYILQSHL